MLPHRTVSFLCLAFSLALTSCLGNIPVNPPALNWRLEDLRLLEAPGNGISDYDMIAAYTRQVGADVEVRVDFLGSPGLNEYDIYFAVDSGPGGSRWLPVMAETGLAWEILFAIPARGSPKAFLARGEPAQVRPRSIRSGTADSFTLRTSLSALGEDWRQAAFEVWISRTGSQVVEDSIGPFDSQAKAQTGQAQIALAFWDVLPAVTPAQALRRWDGAHTGPFGQRHGLKILLEAANEVGVPLMILDLQQPSSLAALDSLGGLDLVRAMQKEGLLLIPDFGLGSDPESAQHNLLAATAAARSFRLERSKYYYGTGTPGEEITAVFARLAEPGYIFQQDSKRVLPLPQPTDGEEDEVSQAGMGTQTRRRLLEAALSGDSSQVTFLGGALPKSPWGDSLIAPVAFSDIMAHPWMRVLDANDLLDIPTQPGSADCPDLLCLANEETENPLRSRILSALKDSPSNLFSELAWQSYTALTSPTSDLALSELRNGYLGQIGPLLAAAKWADTPAEQSACDTDIDWDGNADCILASVNYFFVIDPQGGRLVFGGKKTDRYLVQIIGQRSQMVVGLGDPLEWQPELGAAGDPDDIPGGFGDSTTAWQVYGVDANPGIVTLTHPASETRKTFELDTQGIRITIESSTPVQTRLPLLLIDHIIVEPGEYARYKLEESSQGLTVKPGDRVMLQINGTGSKLSTGSFTHSLPYLQEPEDPDFGYPEGHYLPFPMIVVGITGEKNIGITIH